MTVDVLVEIKAKSIDKTFTYNVPDYLKEKIQIGVRILVPFGNQQLEGFILEINNNMENFDYELKDIVNIIDERPVLNIEMLELGKYISNKTLSTLISAYQTMLPSALKAKKGLTINKKYVSYLKLNNLNNISIKNDKQKQIIDLLKAREVILKKEAQAISISSVKTLLDKKIIIEFEQEQYRIDNNFNIKQDKLKLTNEQEVVVKEVKKNLNTFVPFLLHGVTGSGKTEVYMDIIEEVLLQDKDAIVLVPEISLTPQLVDKFRKRFGSAIAILHSRLSNGEKYDEWRKIERKEVSIVIGARSAIFAPLINLGVIIIDEEHSTTYKQENNPRYNAIDIALYRARKHKCPLILGSATPSVESYTRAKTGVYKLLELKNRVNNNLPKITLVDMKKEIKYGNRILSDLLRKKIIERLEKKEQVILLLNRRGYSTVITCHQCGHTDKCPNCDIPLTYHKSSNTMRCHYCGYGNRKLVVCPKCKSDQINQFGLGTQRLEEEIKKMFPTAKTLRMDVDTTNTKNSHERIIKSFESGEYNILIGTQMIAKGLDFDNVTLVGVLNGDASLNIPDFRSAERTFQLLNQVAGRAGRGQKAGLVVVQTFNQDHYSIVKAKEHDYIGFYNEELTIRRNLKYSPYYNLAVIRIESKDYNLGLQESNKIKKYLLDNTDRQVIILGPSSANILKLNNIYNLQIILKYKKRDAVISVLKEINKKNTNNNKVTIQIDMDPIKI